MTKILTIYALLLLFLSGATVCKADILVSDSFTNGTPGMIITNVLGGGEGWTEDRWATYTGGSDAEKGRYTNNLVYTDWDSYGSGYTPNGNNAVARDYTNPAGTGGDGSTNWFSMLIRPYNSGSGKRVVFFSTTGGSSGSGVGVDIADNGSSITPRSGGANGAAMATSAGTTYCIVGRVIWASSGNEDLKVWLNPTKWLTESDLDSTAGNTSTKTDVDAVAVVSGAAGVYVRCDGGPHAYDIDEIRVGQILKDVTPPPPPGTLFAFE